jgi:[methyl-Co(III) methanol-specific corrinoid protein]:coenzyme M methyltransferase
MNLKERFLKRLQSKEVDMIPVGCTTTYGVIAFMKKCGFELPLADMDPEAMTEMAYAGHRYVRREAHGSRQAARYDSQQLQ